MTKHALFFSQRCQNCTPVMRLLANMEGAMSKIKFYEVERYRSMIPKTVRQIPTLLLNANIKTALVGPEAIIDYFNSSGNQSSQAGQHNMMRGNDGSAGRGGRGGGVGGGNNELLPSAVDMEGNGLSFSFLEDDDKTLGSVNYSYLEGNPSVQQNQQNRGGGGRDNQSRGNMNGRFTQSSGRIDKAAALDSEYEKMMANRDIGIPSAIKRL